MKREEGDREGERKREGERERGREGETYKAVVDQSLIRPRVVKRRG